MKLLADNCVTITFDPAINNAGHDCIRISPDTGDKKLMEIAWREGRTIVTIDKDFGELAVLQQLPHHGILRLVRVRARDEVRVALDAIERYEMKLQNGAIVTAYYGWFRLREADER